MTTPLIIFDLDGTLLDTAPDLMTSLNHVIGTLDLAPVAYPDMTFLVGAGARMMISRALALRETTISETEHERLFDLFLDHYSAEMPGASRPYPGLDNALDRLAAADMKLAVCTNKVEAMALRLLDLTGHLPRFATVTGGDTFAVRKPQAGHILETIKRAGGNASAAIMVGDSINDIAAAANAGIPSIGVPFGYTDKPIAELNPTRVISHYDELTTDLIHTLLTAQ